MINISDISKEVAKELNLREDYVEGIVRYPWRYTSEKIRVIERRPIMHIYIGKFLIKDHKISVLDRIEKLKKDDV